VAGGIRWISDEYTSGDYIANGEPSPASGIYNKEYLRCTSSYSFFFTPLAEEQDTPVSLRRFYSHPTTLTVSFSYQPERETTGKFLNPERDYRVYTFNDEKARGAGLDIEYYIRRDTGLLFHLGSTRKEENGRTSKILSTQNFHGTGENDEIRRYYGLGISHYVFERLNIRLSYTAFDFEYVGSEKEWPEGSPLLFTDYFRDTDTTGKKILLESEYIVRKFLGIQGFYEFLDQKAHSRTLSLYYGNFIDLDSYYDDAISNHTVGTSLSFYVGEETTIRIGASYTAEKLVQTYEADQVIEYDGDIRTIEASILHYLNHHIGVQIAYGFATADRDVVIWHPESEGDPRTTHKVETNLHSVHIGVTGRF